MIPHLKIVPNAAYKRFFWANHDHFNSIFQHKGFNSRKIQGADRHVLPIGRSASVAWCDKELGAAFALGDFPGKSVFTAARAEEKDVECGQCLNVVNVFNVFNVVNVINVANVINVVNVFNLVNVTM